MAGIPALCPLPYLLRHAVGLARDERPKREAVSFRVRNFRSDRDRRLDVGVRIVGFEGKVVGLIAEQVLSAILEHELR